ncbi:MAG: ATP-dependent Clp protease adapter ClpS [Actinomycetota bacterium]|nr:ATP-dependent Clp protease adapter ClpS [Actinomycetota bacterium]
MVKIDEATQGIVEEEIDEAIKDIFNSDKPWVTIVWDDPVNLMTYVTYVLMELFGFTREKAHELMMQVHTQGKAVVSTGSREEMEHDVARLHQYGLWATLARGDKAL